MLDLGDMPATNGDTHGIEANRLERIMLHEIATCDAVGVTIRGGHIAEIEHQYNAFDWQVS